MNSLSRTHVARPDTGTPTAKLPVIMLTAPAPMGGLETVVAALVRGLTDAERPVVLVQLRVAKNASPHALASLTHPLLTHVCIVRAARDYAGLRIDIQRILSEFPGAVLHSHGARADLIAWLAAPHGTRRVSTVHGFVTNSWKQRVARWVHVRVLKRASRVLCVSPALLDELRPALGPRAVLFPNAAPETPLKPREVARTMLGHHRDAPLIGWVGRISHEKGLDVLLKALQQLDDQRPTVVVIGDGPLRDESMAQAASLGIADRIRFLGALADAAQFFAGFDLLVLTSRTEGTPMTILEAMRASVPVVASAVGGVPAMLSDDCGWLVPSEQPAQFAAVLKEVLNAPVEARRRASRALARVESTYSARRWIEAHDHLYTEVSAL